MEKLLNKDFALNCTWKRCLERKLVSKIAKKKKYTKISVHGKHHCAAALSI